MNEPGVLTLCNTVGGQTVVQSFRCGCGATQTRRLDPTGKTITTFEPHALDDDCWCHPRSEPVVRDDGSIGWVIVHNQEATHAQRRR